MKEMCLNMPAWSSNQYYQSPVMLWSRNYKIYSGFVLATLMSRITLGIIVCEAKKIMLMFPKVQLISLHKGQC